MWALSDRARPVVEWTVPTVPDCRTFPARLTRSRRARTPSAVRRDLLTRLDSQWLLGIRLDAELDVDGTAEVRCAVPCSLDGDAGSLRRVADGIDRNEKLVVGRLGRGHAVVWGLSAAPVITVPEFETGETRLADRLRDRAVPMGQG